MSPGGDGVTATWIRLPAEHRHGSQRVLRSCRPAVRGWPKAGTPLTFRGTRPTVLAFGHVTRIAARSSEVRELGAASWCRKRESEPLSGLARDRGPLRGRARRWTTGRNLYPARGPSWNGEGYRSDRQSPSRADPVVGEYPGGDEEDRGRRVRVSHSGRSQSTTQREAGTEETSLEDPGHES